MVLLWAGPENKVLTELAECRQYCVEGLKEAEACGDVEVQAEFLVQGALLNIMEGRSLEQTVAILDVTTAFIRSYVYYLPRCCCWIFYNW